MRTGVNIHETDGGSVTEALPDADLDALIARTKREIQTMPLSEPGKGEFYGRCHWSRTGWAVWKMGDMRSDSYCTCRPTKDPQEGKRP